MATLTQAYRFALDPTPAQERRLASHAGAARFAYNWGLARVKACLQARAWERRILGGAVTEAPFTLAALRREWNEAKEQVAPWWAENSKEAYSSGLQALADGLDAWSQSRSGRRRGRRVGFPRFKRRGRARESFRYTTGSFGVSGRTRVQLPRVGHVRSHEPTTKLQRKLAAGRARVLSATLAREGGRWFCSLTCEVERSVPAPPDETVGVDVGINHLAVLSTGETIANPRSLAPSASCGASGAGSIASAGQATPAATTSAAGRSRVAVPPTGLPARRAPSARSPGCTPAPGTCAATACTSSRQTWRGVTARSSASTSTSRECSPTSASPARSTTPRSPSCDASSLTRPPGVAAH